MKRNQQRAEFEIWEELYFLGKGSHKFRNSDLLADLLESDGPFFMSPRLRRELAEILRDHSKLRDKDERKKAKEVEEEWIFWFHYQNLKNGMTIGDSKSTIADRFGSSFDRIDKLIQRKYAQAKEKNEARWKEVYTSLQDKS